VFLLREAGRADLDAIYELARYLDSPNLPQDRDFLGARLERSERSFGEPGEPSADREYQFVLVDDTDRVVGTCAIISKHGTPLMPHVFLRVRTEERSSRELDVRVQHRTFQLEANDDGPTELGALVLHPSVRGAPGSPGKLLSWGRFAYIGLYPNRFESHILAEMRATLDAQGRSMFWDAFGKRFTTLSYAEADRRSSRDKSFILDLFPSTPFYTAMLPDDVVNELGRVHSEAEPALRLLEAAGLQWIGEIDPFDAGPFYGAPIYRVIPVRETHRTAIDAPDPIPDSPRAIISTEEGGSFRAVAVPAQRIDGRVRIGKEAQTRLGVDEGDSVAWTPLPPPSQRKRNG
jgi:arginine N-succinyltransferase